MKVRNMTLGIRHGECFGFLGVNGVSTDARMPLLVPRFLSACVHGIRSLFARKIREDRRKLHIHTTTHTLEHGVRVCK